LNLSTAFLQSISLYDVVRHELHRLRNEATLTLSIKPLQQQKGPGLFAISHNAQSVVRHLPDIQADPDFFAADIIHLTETLDTFDTLQMPVYNVIYNSTIDERQHGSAIFFS
jgi:hypothetical protein